MSEEIVQTIRDTPLGECIGATILDITGCDPEDWLTGKPERVYFHLSNGKTIFATMGGDNVGMAEPGEDDEEETA